MAKSWIVPLFSALAARISICSTTLPVFASGAANHHVLGNPTASAVVKLSPHHGDPCLTARTDFARSTCFEYDIDYYGSDIMKLEDGRIRHPQACQQMCAQTVGCAYWTFIPETSACYLKSKAALQGRTCRPSAISGPRVCPSPHESCYEVNTDYIGCDEKIVDRHVQSAQECHLLCLAFPRCKFWTWVSPRRKCHLKNEHAHQGRVHATGSISGPRQCIVVTRLPPLECPPPPVVPRPPPVVPCPPPVVPCPPPVVPRPPPVDCRPPPVDCHPPPVDCHPPPVDCHPPPVDCRPPVIDCRPSKPDFLPPPDFRPPKPKFPLPPPKFPPPPPLPPKFVPPPPDCRPPPPDCRPPPPDCRPPPPDCRPPPPDCRPPPPDCRPPPPDCRPPPPDCRPPRPDYRPLPPDCRPPPTDFLPPPTDCNDPGCSKNTYDSGCYDHNIVYTSSDIELKTVTRGPRECQQLCQQHPACRGFSYLPLRNTCFLKRHSGWPLRLKDAISGPKYCFTPQCVVKDVEYYGITVHTVSLPSFIACHKLCQLDLRCAAVTYSHISNICRLIQQTRKLPGTVSGPKWCRASGGNAPAVAVQYMDSQGISFCHDPAVAYTSRPFSARNLDSAELCQQQCRQQSRCKYFTYFLYGKVCLMHEVEGQRVPNVTAVSGPRDCPPSSCFYENVEVYGKEVERCTADSAAACQKFCQRNKFCSFFVYDVDTKLCLQRLHRGLASGLMSAPVHCGVPDDQIPVPHDTTFPATPNLPGITVPPGFPPVPGHPGGRPGIGGGLDTILPGLEGSRPAEIDISTILAWLIPGLEGSQIPSGGGGHLSGSTITSILPGLEGSRIPDGSGGHLSGSTITSILPGLEGSQIPNGGGVYLSGSSITSMLPGLEGSQIPNGGGVYLSGSPVGSTLPGLQG